MIAMRRWLGDEAVRLTQEVFWRAFGSLNFWLGLSIAGLALAIAAPFGTDETLNIFQRIVYWTCIATGAEVIGFLICPPTFLFLTKRGLDWKLASACSGVAAAPLVVLFVFLVNTAVVPHVGLGRLADAQTFALAVAALTVAGAILHLLVIKDYRTLATRVVGPHPPNVFAKRLSPRNRAAILTVQAQGHYVDVHTEGGRELVLFRLKDAIGELDPCAGRQVHRSWWVARSAVAKAERYNGKVRLILEDGRHVPVSQMNLTQTKAWLDRPVARASDA